MSPVRTKSRRSTFDLRRRAGAASCSLPRNMQGLRPPAPARTAVVSLLLAVWGAGAGLAQEAEWATVLRVLDGQTIEVEWRGRRETVRYIGVAAPELRHPVEDPDEDHWARRAQYWNQRLVQGRRVRLELDALPRDRQGRLLAYVFTEEETFVNAWLIEFGFAEADGRPPNLRYQALLTRLDREAREKARGLWLRR